jgi:hypothetical protein
MRRCIATILLSLVAAAASATSLPSEVRLGVVDALAPRLSAGFGKAASADRAPTIRDEWQLGAVAREQTLARLNAQGYRAQAVRLPAALEQAVRSGGALETHGSSVQLTTKFGRDLDRWLRAQQLDGVVVLRSLARPLEAGAPAQNGYGIARRGQTPVAYANLMPLLIHGSPPMIAGAPQCLVSVPVDSALIATPKALGELAALRPALEDALRRSIDGALIRAGVTSGEAACE